MNFCCNNDASNNTDSRTYAAQNHHLVPGDDEEENELKRLKLRQQSVSNSKALISVEDELNKYFQTEVHCYDMDKTDFDILHFWKNAETEYPNVAILARNILGVQATSVGSESTFSTSGRILNDYRSRLSGHSAEMLVCCQSWLKYKGSFKAPVSLSTK